MLQDVLDITRHILSLYGDDPTYMGDPYDVESRDEKIEKLTQVRSVFLPSPSLPSFPCFASIIQYFFSLLPPSYLIWHMSL